MNNFIEALQGMLGGEVWEATIHLGFTKRYRILEKVLQYSEDKGYTWRTSKLDVNNKMSSWKKVEPEYKVTMDRLKNTILNHISQYPNPSKNIFVFNFDWEEIEKELAGE